MTAPLVSATAHPGDGPWLLLAPSLGTSGRLWQDALPALGAHFRPVTWDLPGHGDSKPTTEAFSVADLAQSVIRVADDLGAEEFFYAGDSLGGGIGLQLLLDFPERVTAAGIICSAAKFTTPEAWHERAAAVRAGGTSPLVGPSAQRWFAPESIARRPEAAGELLHVLQDTDDESYALCCDALAEFDVRDHLGEIAAPVLAIFGRHDVSTPEATLREIAEGVQHGTLVEAAQSAHLAPAEEPEFIARQLTEFFGSVA